MEATRDSIAYFYVFDEEIQLNKTTEANPLIIKFLGKTIKITDIDTSVANKFTAYVGNEYIMDTGDTVTVDNKKVILKNVNIDGSVIVDVDSIVETIPADTSKVVNGIEIVNDETYTNSASLIIGTSAQATYNDQDPYPGEDENNPNWVWKIGNLHTKSSTYIGTSWSDNTKFILSGPYIGIENEFILNDNTDNPPQPGDCIDLPNKYLSICLDSLTVLDNNYMTLEINYEAGTDLSEALPNQNKTNVPTIYIHSSLPMGIKLDADASNFFKNGSITDKKVSKIWLYPYDPGYLYYPNQPPTHDNIAVLYEDDNGKTQIFGYINGNGTVTFSQINFDETINTNVQLRLANNTLTIQAIGDNYDELRSGQDEIILKLKRGKDFLGFGNIPSTAEADELLWQSNLTDYNQNATIGTKDEDHRTAYGIIVRDPKNHLASDELILEIPGDQVKANVVVKGNTLILNNPPVYPKTVNSYIQNISWDKNTAKNNAFDLDDYFYDPDNDTLTYYIAGNLNIQVNIDPITHLVSFSQPNNWFGVEKVTFIANDGKSSIISNKITLTVLDLTCTPNWTPVNNQCQINDKKSINYYDANLCNSTIGIPSDNGTYIQCNYCTQNIQGPLYTSWSSCSESLLNKERIKYYNDLNYNNCCAVTNLVSDCDIKNLQYQNVTENSSCITVNNPKQGIYKTRKLNLNIYSDVYLNKLDYINYNDKKPKWTTLCTNCYSYNKSKTFNEGNNNITISFNSETILNEILFFVDSIDPNIDKTYPKSRSYINKSSFIINYTEDNLKEISLYINGNKILTKADCPKGKKQGCVFTPNINSYNNQKISYYFTVEDAAGNIDITKPIEINVDMTNPIITKSNYDKTSMYFDIVVSENVDLKYHDSNSRSSSWVTLCRNCSTYNKKKSFNKDTSSIIIKAIDKAGNFDQKTIPLV